MIYLVQQTEQKFWELRDKPGISYVEFDTERTDVIEWRCYQFICHNSKNFINSIEVDRKTQYALENPDGRIHNKHLIGK